MNIFAAGLDGITFASQGSRLLGGFYRAAGDTPRPTAVLLHGMPGVEKHLDVAYQLRDLGWNCLYFHPRGSWGSAGDYTVAGQIEDVQAAMAWTKAQPSVDVARVAVIGGSVGGYTMLRYAAQAEGIAAVVALCPVIDPAEFAFSDAMAQSFAAMLQGVTADALQRQWLTLPAAVAAPHARHPLLLVTGDRDELFPPSHYAPFAAQLPSLHWARAANGDHSLSECRGWLVETVSSWLCATVGR